MKAKKVYNKLMSGEIKSTNIIDIREKYELSNGKVSGSKNIPMNTLLQKPEKYLNKNEEYYLMCQSGARSLSTWVTLKFKGYKVINVSGGYMKWKEL